MPPSLLFALSLLGNPRSATELNLNVNKVKIDAKQINFNANYNLIYRELKFFLRKC